MRISIADRKSNAKALARLFSSNLTPSYISHAELQGYRAIRPGEWAKDIDSLLYDEISQRLKRPLDGFPARRSWRGVVEAHEGDALVGLAFVTVEHEAAVPFGIIEDIVIDGRLRGAGRGKKMMQWIADQFRQAGLKRAFLESGMNNHRAHELFEHLGFQQVSIVMAKELGKTAADRPARRKKRSTSATKKRVKRRTS